MSEKTMVKRFGFDANGPYENVHGEYVLASEKSSVDKLKELMRRCKCGVYVTVNAHRDVYETAEMFLSETSTQGDHEHIQIDPAVKAKMIETNTVIEVQFYPNTPISFYVLRHYDLDAALDQALACFDDGAKP
jgi:hypothetical protein